MKKFLITGCILSLLAIVSCSKEDNTNNNDTGVNAVTQNISAGNWRITMFWEEDHYETANFSGFAFVFKTDNTVSAAKDATTINGNWSAGTDDSKTKLNLSFITPESFTELNEDWEVLESTSARVRLLHVSGGDGSRDSLIFEKN
ncbi:MAG: hypothetical protein QM791_05295 [Ferruginibacter sp.]